VRAVVGATVCAALASCGSGTEARESGQDGAQFLRIEDSTPEDVAAPPATHGAEANAPSTTAPEAADQVAPAAPVVTSTPAAQPATASRALEPVVGAPDERERNARNALDSGAFASAARQYSTLLLDGVRSEPPADREALRRWTASLNQAQANHRWSRAGAWPSIEMTVQPGDSLIAIRLRALAANPGLLLSTGLIARANQLPSETSIRPGDVLRIPTDRASVLVDISAMWTVFLLGDEVAAAWEVGVGKDSSPTRPGDYTIGLKQKEPMWSPVGRSPVPFGDPENPLGTRWLAWFEQGKNTSLGFHGTNDAAGIGRRVSDGCVRMRNEDVELLFEILPKDSAARVAP
jgi:lipoprotein-anchoring transpeptidase ErfK/SrfK